MKAAIIIAAALAASANGAVIEGRVPARTSSRPSNPGDVAKCGLDAFLGHASEASLFCSSILKGGTATVTSTSTALDTTTTKTTVYTTLYPPTAPSSTPLPPTSTPKPPTSTPTQTPTPTSATPTTPSSSPLPTQSASCGLVGYTGSIAAYYFDSSGTLNTFTACSAACKADSKCKSFGYGEANCLLFDVPAGGNTNYNPSSPYTFYDASCPVELPVRKRQIEISLSLGNNGITSACSCLITSAPGQTTKTTTVTASSRVTSTQTVTRTVSLLPDLRKSA